MLWESGRMNYWRYNIHANKEPHDRFFRENVHKECFTRMKANGIATAEIASRPDQRPGSTHEVKIRLSFTDYRKIRKRARTRLKILYKNDFRSYYIKKYNQQL